jgi:hypothetical protein
MSGNKKVDLRHEKKKIDKRHATPDEIIFIFEKSLAGCRTISIYNEIMRNNQASKVTKRIVESVATGNSKIRDFETTPEKFQYYKTLRAQVYEYRKNQKMLKKGVESDLSDK